MPNASTRTLKWFYKLSWKKILGFNAFVMLVASFWLARQLALSPTRTQSKAALLPRPQEITSQFETPTGPPQVYLVDHFFGKVGDAVLIHGKNLGGASDNTWVALAGKRLTEADLVAWTGSFIEFRVPQGATSGPVTVNVLGQETAWEGVFFVIDETTPGQLRLVADETNPNKAVLSVKGLADGNSLLLWFLVVSGEGEVTIAPAPGVNFSQVEKNLPVGKIYEVNLTWNQSLNQASVVNFVPLLTVTRGAEMSVGVARAELTNANGALIPLGVHPLYVSF
ncbi:MAG: hypothetical protein UX85_C0001G0207 [Candidatus Beckwithbacteria bacterium GW2011_GWB1_47_15]|uniref:IPT/TIG domain-containing protein n=1 Tax=Candidatus Beckwithbacteria bacterium GW2011_GWB1_47_15 TaxID=1618371 RepID=A0A0G1U714_9BACT|nr:MAG: Uncharacterized protein UY43_C0001G0918 [Candidatus Beckwithbacteria bacterium GW2011_GWC1_49_16]AQS30844.1 hypothetical protein [uncultured bacterium]KKU36029.1 MAG: hypothetical protein UX50_C0001G0206 [Candidatus Beckwithbacteria bacterium GW2011_GWA1_46_30]KKU61993.1 MAG: hypothetical protein UX85_C0001G0207 [Candidatus Beckwithbacteria bacterium GW2011_GWB1_47_15]KKU72453.1 MAG: hypothetical protein UX97_C0001G0323 [Candidatus Beckwithbacteria bacterium GW2011_GWA2_47_25]KKW04380.